VIARLRASLKATADRTPISAGRSSALAALAEQAPARGLMPALSAAAAVATVVAVGVVVANSHPGSHRTVQSGSGGPGAAGASSTAAASTLPSKPKPVPSSAAPQQSDGGCVPENYYVIASPAEVAGLTYMLPATPAGYVLYGAWGTISRNLCADSVTWYVEYEPVAGTPGSGTNAYQLTVTKVGGDSVRGDFASRSPVASTPITVNGTEGYVFDKGTSYAVIGWTMGGASITLGGPGDTASLVHVADSVALLNPGDPRIVAPANCQVPPGSTCPSESARPTPTVTPTPKGGPTLTGSPTPTGNPTQANSPAPTDTPTSTYAVTGVPTPTPTSPLGAGR
jgi:hypothetical protein